MNLSWGSPAGWKGGGNANQSPSVGGNGIFLGQFILKIPNNFQTLRLPQINEDFQKIALLLKCDWLNLVSGTSMNKI